MTRTSTIARPWLSSTLPTLLSIVGLASLTVVVGSFLVGSTAVVVGLIVAVLLMGRALPLSERWLALQGAVPLRPWQAPALHRTVARLATRAGLEHPPQVYLLPGWEANALTTGQRPGAVALTRGLLEALDDDELEGVLAHEIAHLRARDTTLMQIAATAADTLITLLQLSLWIAFFTALFGGSGGRLLLIAALALSVPTIARWAVAALSRAREYAADATAAALTGRPRALARALAKLARQRRAWLPWLLLARPMVPPALRSHPPTRERIRRLNALAPAQRPRAVFVSRPAPTPWPAQLDLSQLR